MNKTELYWCIIKVKHDMNMVHWFDTQYASLSDITNKHHRENEEKTMRNHGVLNRWAGRPTTSISWTHSAWLRCCSCSVVLIRNLLFTVGSYLLASHQWLTTRLQCFNPSKESVHRGLLDIFLAWFSRHARSYLTIACMCGGITHPCIYHINSCRARKRMPHMPFAHTHTHHQ